MSDSQDKSLRTVSKRKILFIELDEEITHIFERIKPLPYADIFLVVPNRSILLQSVVNLKILKQKLAEIDKNMAIITKDVSGMKLAQQADIRVYDHWSVDDDDDPEHEESETLIKPIRATSNEVEDDSPTRLSRKKASIFDVVKEQRDGQKVFSVGSLFRRGKEAAARGPRFSQQGKRFALGGLFLSLAIFFVIAYVVLPGATLMIEPAADVITQAINVELSRTAGSTNNQLNATPVSTQVDWSITYSSSGLLSEGQRSSGLVTLINVSGQEWPLVEETRLQTEDGLVFRLQGATTVPSGTEANPGRAEASVLADELDANGAPIGQRGNIGPSRFFLPGLRDDSRALLYAESYEAMTGGETQVTSFVLEEDLLAAQSQLEAQLREKALSSLRKEVLSLGTQQGGSLSLLEDSKALNFGEAIIQVPYQLVGQAQDSFELQGSLSVSGVAYDREELLSLLRRVILEAQTPGKQLVRINEDSISIDVLEANNSALSYKFTAQIQGIEEYLIDASSEAGADFVRKIKENIAGKSIDEAKAYVQNLTEVNRVDISVWPSWSPNIPNLPDNIRVKSSSEEEAVL